MMPVTNSRELVPLVPPDCTQHSPYSDIKPTSFFLQQKVLLLFFSEKKKKRAIKAQTFIKYIL